MNLSESIKVVVVAGPAAAAQTEVVSSVVDLTGYSGVVFVAVTGDVTDTSVLTLTAKGNSANSTSSPTPVSQGSATFTAGATDADNKALVVDVHAPALRYAFASFTRTTANAVVSAIVAILYAASFKPTTNDATVIAASVVAGKLS